MTMPAPQPALTPCSDLILLDLPPEILLHLLTFVQVPDLLALSRVCGLFCPDRRTCRLTGTRLVILLGHSASTHCSIDKDSCLPLMRSPYTCRSGRRSPLCDRPHEAYI
jgi:hypothetical protein